MPPRDEGGMRKRTRGEEERGGGRGGENLRGRRGARVAAPPRQPSARGAPQRASEEVRRRARRGRGGHGQQAVCLLGPPRRQDSRCGRARPTPRPRQRPREENGRTEWSREHWIQSTYSK